MKMFDLSKCDWIPRQSPDERDCHGRRKTYISILILQDGLPRNDGWKRP
jgi:hypothetical protein